MYDKYSRHDCALTSGVGPSSVSVSSGCERHLEKNLRISTLILVKSRKCACNNAVRCYYNIS